MEVKKIKNTTFSGNLMRLMSGGILSTVLGFIIMPVLTRLYLPSEFGVFSLFFSIVSVLSVISCMRYEITIVLPPSDNDAANLLMVSILSVSVFSLFLILVIILYDGFENILIGLESIGRWIYLIPLVVFINGIYLSLYNWNTRNKFFFRLSVAQVLNQLVSGGLKLLLAVLISPVGLTMIFSNICAKISSVVLFIIHCHRSDFKFIINAVSIASMKNLAKRYRNFPLFGGWSILLGVLAWQLPIILLAYYYSPEIVGFYSLAFSMLEIPMRFVGGALGQVFYQRAAELRNDKILTEVVETLFQKLIAIFLFPMLILTLVGGDFFTLVFGEQWREAGIYAQIMSMWLFCWFLTAPFTKLFAVFEKQKAQMWWNLFNFASRLLILCWAGTYSEPRTAIIFLSLVGIIIYVVKIVMTLAVVDVSFIKILFYIFHQVTIFLPTAAIIILADTYINIEYAGLAIALFILMLFGFFVANKLYPDLKKLISIEVVNDK